MIAYEQRERVVNVQVCYCDRCGCECPQHRDTGYKSGNRRHQAVSVSMLRYVERGAQEWAFGGDYETSNPVICYACLDELKAWFTL